MTATRWRSTLRTMFLGLAIVLVSALVKPSYRLLYNTSDSAPRGWYTLVPAHDIGVDTLVFARLPSDAEALAAERGYLPRSVPLLKHVAATHGHHVCNRAGVIMIDGAPVGRALARDGAGRALEQWTQCRSLQDDELFLLGDNSPASFDSRYFGPVNLAAVVGEAIPLWTW